MKKILLTLAAVLATMPAFARGIEVVSDVQIEIPSGEASYSPVMSPNGEYLLLTSGTLEGLKKYDLTTGVLSTVTTDKGAGYNAQISDDGNLIVYRESAFRGRLRYNTVKSVNLEDGETRELVSDSRQVTAWGVQDGTALALEDGKVKSRKIYGRKVENPVIVSVEDGNLMVTRYGKTLKLNPCGDVRYLWQSLSPDGRKILFAIAERGAVAYVCNLDGGNLVRLGRMSAPKWMGNDWVVGMDDKDNGQYFTSSVIVAVRATGGDYTVLTDSSKISMYPSASLNADKIVYNTGDGKIFMLNVVTE